MQNQLKGVSRSMINDNKILDWLNEEDLPTTQEEKEIERKSYEVKIVGWIDILGIRAKIKNEEKYDAEAIINIMSELASYVSAACDKYCAKDEMSYLQIADGFMIVSDLKNANQLCSILAEIQWKILIKLKMLARGAVTAGNVSVTNEGNLIIGPAYVDAYAMESENAIYARIILSDDFIEATKDFCTFKYLKEDTDKVMYIDYIDYIMTTQTIDEKRMSKLFIEQGVSASLKEDFMKINKLTIRQKYGWTFELLSRNKITI